MTNPHAAGITGPLEIHGPGFAAELSRQGYTANSQRLLLQLVAHLSRWMGEQGIDAAGLEPAAVERFVAARRNAGYSNHRSTKALEPLLDYLRGLGATPSAPAPVASGPIPELLARFRRYLATERGLAEATIAGYLHAVEPFLTDRETAEGLGLRRLKASDLITFASVRCPQQGRGSAKMTVTALRSLVGFLHLEGEIDRPLAAAVPSAASWRGASLPKRLEPTEVEALLASCDQATANGLRDLAIITTLVRLGLRRGEVAGLELGDIDWRGGEIVIRGKGGSIERLPLPADVGELIAAYLSDGRSAEGGERSVFVRVRAPHRGLSPGAVTQVVVAAARRSGLGQIHAHRLRHTAASELLRAGASLPEVGQLLRHRSIRTTAIYAKVDRNSLREIVRPWPEAGR